MEILIILIAVVALVFYFFRVIIAVVVMIIGFASSGFFAGLGMGLCTYFILSLIHWFLFTMGMANVYRRLYRDSINKEK